MSVQIVTLQNGKREIAVQNNKFYAEKKGSRHNGVPVLLCSLNRRTDQAIPLLWLYDIDVAKDQERAAYGTITPSLFAVSIGYQASICPEIALQQLATVPGVLRSARMVCRIRQVITVVRSGRFGRRLRRAIQ